METLSNGILTVEVSGHGAELCSIRKGGTEYLWQADPAFWKRHSPVLFPIVGSVWNGHFKVDGKEYRMSQHGFARDMDFRLLAIGPDEVRYILESDEGTLALYPYRFALIIGYRLVGSRIEVSWSVSNTSDKEIHFQIGAHPAFYYPDFDPSSAGRGFFLLEGPSAPGEMEYYLVKEKGCADPDTKYTLRASFPSRYSRETDDIAARLAKEGRRSEILPLDTHTFDRDVLIFDDSQIDKVTLLTGAGDPWLGMKFDSPLLGLWSPGGKNAPFVCIEPWFGRCDRVGYDGEFRFRDHVMHLAPMQTFNAGYEIEIF